MSAFIETSLHWRTTGRQKSPPARRDGVSSVMSGESALYQSASRLTRLCPGSAHVRQRRIALAESLKMLCWDLPAKGVVWPEVVESMGEGVDEGLELIDSRRRPA